MANGARIVEGMRKTALTAQELTLFKQSFVIVPYLPSGFLDYTNRGFSNNLVSPEDFETFKRIWTGNDAFTIAWKGSVVAEQQPNKEFDITYKLGDVFLGVLETTDSQVVVDTDKSFNDYTSQEIQDRLTFRVNSFFNITDHYKLMFYKFPEITKSTLYRIESLEKDFVGTKLIGYVITFKSINQDFSNTGRARQQNVMPSSIGQGYLECIVKDSTWPDSMTPEEWDKLVDGQDYYKFYDRYITADFQKQLNRPVQKVVVRLLGTGILNSFTMFGRPVLYGDSFKKFRSPRLIFPYGFSNPTTPNLFRTQSNANNMYFGSFSPTLDYFKELMESIKDSFTPVNKWEYQGFLEYNYIDLQGTNPLLNNAYSYDLFGFLEKTDLEIKLVPWILSTPTSQISTSGNYGCDIAYTIGGSKNIHDHMFDNYWTQKQFITMPMNKQSTATFGSTIQSAAAALFRGSWYAAAALGIIGISGTLVGKLYRKTISGFRGIISAPIIDYNNQLFNGNKMPFNILDTNSEDNPNSIFLSNATSNISFEAGLTDSISSARVPNKTLSTICIGQRLDEKGEYILDSEDYFLLNGDTKLVEREDDKNGYIIDSFQIQACFNGDISVEFIDSFGEVAWSGVYQSEGKWTNSMREIWTEKNCSVFNRENMFFTEPLPYPEKIPDPLPDYPVGYMQTYSFGNEYVTQGQYALLGVNDLFAGYFREGIPYAVVNPIYSYILNKTIMSDLNIKRNIRLFTRPREELISYYKQIELHFNDRVYIVPISELINSPTRRYHIFDNHTGATNQKIDTVGYYYNDPPLQRTAIQNYVKTESNFSNGEFYYEDGSIWLEFTPTISKAEYYSEWTRNGVLLKLNTPSNKDIVNQTFDNNSSFKLDMCVLRPK